ncbi:MAG: hypothetical protein PVJ57_17485 [Phycisphaerae bacterium]|jgi:hypothetical protein
MQTRKVLLTVVLGIALTCCVTVAGQTASPALSTSPDGRVTCTLPDGQPAWVFHADQPWPVAEYADGTGTLIDRAMLLDDSGRLVLRLGDPAVRPWLDPLSRESAWQALAQLRPAPGDGESDSAYGPVFDSEGNAWLLIVHSASSGKTITVRRSDGHTGTWQPADVLLETTNYIGRCGITITPDDEVIVMYRRLASSQQIQIIRYIPGTGWTSPETPYSGAFFQSPEVAADSDGNVIVSFDGPPNNSTMYTAIYDADAGTWAAATQLSPADSTARLPTLVQNEDGTAIYALYWVSSGTATPGIYAHRFDSATKTWLAGVHLDQSDGASFPGGIGPFTRLLAVANRAGEATVCYEIGDGSIQANRTAAGVWQRADPLLPANVDDADLQNFAGGATGPTGDTFLVFQRCEIHTTGLDNVWTLLFDGATGSWQTPSVAYSDTSTITTRTRIAFRGGDHAVATFRGAQAGEFQITSALFDGTTWSPDLLDIPTTYQAFMQETGTDAGDVLLCFEGEGGLFGPNYGVFATWLPGIAGDVNCDGAVNNFDIKPFVQALTATPPDYPEYYAAYPDCNHMNGDINGDGVVDNFDIAPFVSLLAGSP